MNAPVRASAVAGHLSRPSSTKTDRYFVVWALTLPITSVLVIPFVQGTTPGNVFALALLFPPVAALLMSFERGLEFYRRLGFLVLVFVALTAVAQFSLAGSGLLHFGGVHLVDPADKAIVLKRTLFTQSLYLLAAACTFVYVRMFYSPSWDRFLFAGAVLFGLYGLYELAFFAIFGHSGDFVTNRRFGEGSFTGSWFQTIAIGPILMQRLKSLTGEPSMYAFTILPFWIYAIHTGRHLMQLLLLATLVLTTTTTAFVGICLYLAYRLIRYGLKDPTTLIAMTAGALIGLALLSGNEFLSETAQKTVTSKLSLESYSSIARFRGFERGMEFFWSAPLMTQLFGVGFGYVRSTDMLSTLLINTGFVGFALTTIIFAIPVFRLGTSYEEEGLKAALLVIFVTLMISVPEYAFLSTWVFMGIAYCRIERRRSSIDAEALERRRRSLRASVPESRQSPDESDGVCHAHRSRTFDIPLGSRRNRTRRRNNRSDVLAWRRHALRT
jgi:hypothetical protein